ncbi:exported hypothetical protein [Actinacidiphila cocklensis]|uniref:Uncharacterized protein n=1 Tax=Actinacidiphila cocklensis TaxID=887465 RepID=A0A9W4GVH1_9ACTN|nr:exported hypothetical protein [Actinacidiphila cocklensis]
MMPCHLPGRHSALPRQSAPSAAAECAAGRGNSDTARGGQRALQIRPVSRYQRAPQNATPGGRRLCARRCGRTSG